MVLLPGIYEPWDFLQPVATRLAALGHPIHAVPGLRRNDRPVRETADVVAQYLDQTDLRDAVVVAHSKGGLIGKCVMLGPAGARIAGMVTFATPFAGSPLARLTVGHALRSFDPRDPVLRWLDAQPSVNGRITALYPCFDPHIPGTERLDGARNIELPLPGHFRPLGHPLLVDVLTREVVRRAAVGRSIVETPQERCPTCAPPPQACSARASREHLARHRVDGPPFAT